MKKSKAKSMTIDEASDFFDDHDIFESGEPIEVSDIRIELARKEYIGVDSALFKKIKSKAKKLKMNEDALINAWLKEKAG